MDNPVVITTPAPIPLEHVKRKFKEDVRFVIDYSNSKFKGTTLLTYISNLGLNCEIQYDDYDGLCELLKAYLHYPGILDIGSLEDFAMNIILRAVGSPLYELDDDMDDFIKENFDIIDKWVERLAMVPVFALHVNPDTKHLIERFPENTDSSPAGLNFAKLIDHPKFALLTPLFGEDVGSYNKVFFDEYCFSGKNLFYFFQRENNPYWLALMVESNKEKFSELASAYLSMKSPCYFIDNQSV